MSVLLKIISFACLLSIAAVNAEQADLESLVGSEIPLFQCASPSGATLTRDGITQLRKLREKANKYCLTCKGDQCIAKQWPEERAQERQLCQSLYCVPARFPTYNLADEIGWQEHAAQVSYKVNRRGRGQLLNYQATENADAISPYQAEVAESVNAFLKNTRFVALEVDGDTKELVNLSYKLKVPKRK